eukprot:scaffold9639_cov24-Phaeocystis_antarctica.AAC.1
MFQAGWSRPTAWHARPVRGAGRLILICGLPASLPHFERLKILLRKTSKTSHGTSVTVGLSAMIST